MTRFGLTRHTFNKKELHICETKNSKNNSIFVSLLTYDSETLTTEQKANKINEQDENTQKNSVVK